MGNLLRVNEVFGPTLQGEGPHQGRTAWFLRMSGCNLDCSWCDTPYTWDWTGKNGVAYDREDETQMWAESKVAVELRALGFTGHQRLIISGGEPMLQQRQLTGLIEGWQQVEIETNGTIKPDAMFAPHVRLFVISPKIASSGVSVKKREKPEAIAELKRWPSIWKFVVCTPDDLDEVAVFVDRHDLPADHVWVMPEGQTRAEIEDKLKWSFDETARRGWNWTPRLHVLAHDAKRGI